MKLQSKLKFLYDIVRKNSDFFFPQKETIFLFKYVKLCIKDKKLMNIKSISLLST